MTLMTYVGLCYDSGAWGGDLTGVLLRQEDDGSWLAVAQHISSNPQWSEKDIGAHLATRKTDRDSYEWLGLLTVEEIKARFNQVGS